MNQHALQLFDAFISIIASVGLFPPIMKLYSQGHLSGREKRILLTLVIMSFFLFVRAPFYVLDSEVFGAITYATSIFLALSVALYFETLLRRHFPLWFKIFIALGCGIFFVLSVTTRIYESNVLLISYAIFIVALDGLTILFCVFRKNDQLTKLENQLINANLISLVLIGPFFLTDIKALQLTDSLKLGPIGGLLFAAIVFFNSGFYHRRGKILLEILQICLVSIIFTMMLSLLFEVIHREVLIRIFIMFLELALCLKIYRSTRYSTVARQMLGFMQQLSLAKKRNVEEFLRDASEVFTAVESRTVTAADLKHHDVDRMKEFFETLGKRSLNQAQLVEMCDDWNQSPSDNHKNLDMCEQLLEILQANDMTHICWLVDNPMTFLLIHIPVIGQTEMIETETAMISEFSKLIHRSPRA